MIFVNFVYFLLESGFKILFVCIDVDELGGD